MLVVTIFLILLIILMSALYQEMERRDALFLNATLSSNASLFLANDFDDAWLNGFVTENLTLNINDTSGVSEPSAGVKVRVKVQPDWSVVEGKFEHFKDENFEALLIAVGVPYFVRNMILGTSPTVEIEHAVKGGDYYYDIEDDYISDEDQPNGESPDPGYQLIITTSTWMRTAEERFRPGYSFSKNDYDGSPSKNTYRFVSPRVLVHRKEKEKMNTDIVRTFDEQGFVMTIISKEADMIAKRHFKRILT
ncbi:uncharacterized protein LOC122251849 [Penaeus japonicus]|uniref:uncharacterized protein LOC122251849 n=1 Tax=Penaeus japonicus TaxID=27405 RepID=UPI001C7127E9|nr:uncharacterized protein LOC122251849 [Penaeus japonicus]